MQNSFGIGMLNKFEGESPFAGVSLKKRRLDPSSNMGEDKKNVKICAICGKYSHFKFYNVQSCEGCKQFFRRIIVRQTEFFCSLDGNCDYVNNKCRGCRLDQCLLMGMQPNCVQTERGEYFGKFVIRMQRRREIVLSRRIPTKREEIGTNVDFEQESPSYFCRLIAAQKALWSGFANVPDSYLGQFQTIEEVLEGPENILFLGDDSFLGQFKPLTAKQMNQILEEAIKMENLGMHRRIQKAQGVFLLMVVGIFKAIPAFKKLKFEDKLILVRKLAQTINFFICAYFSAKIPSNVIVGSSGGSMLAMFRAKYRNDAKILKLSEKTFVRPMDAFLRIPLLEQEEYALLLAIFCSNSTISGLSEHGRELLEAEQSCYSRLLMRHLQTNLGGARGAKRFAECVQLIDSACHAAHNLELMHTYIEVFHSGKEFYAGIYPECLKSLIK